jgi:hypothetical protein
MDCCKIGCTEEPKQCQDIAYRNQQGSLIRNKICWCKEHSPDCVLECFEPIELLRDKGASY